MASKILIDDKKIVIPGEVLAEGMDYLPSNGTYRKGDQIISNRLGFVNIRDRFVKVIPLGGKYVASRGDLVIGEVFDVVTSGWLVNIGSPYSTMLSLREVPEFVERGADLTRYYNIGDVIIAKVSNIIRGRGVDLTMKGQGLRKVKGGRIVDVTPSKVPRVIGKQGSMISLIKEKTGCSITVGQNGKVYIKGEDSENELKAYHAVMKIEEESHTDGLTDKIGAFLSGGKK
jgi:exosome complex component RRP4